jgi:hypothetical protein
VLSESEWYISASVGATIAGGLIRDVEASEKFLDSSCGDHPKATRDCTYSGRIDTVPSIVGRPTDPPSMPPKASPSSQPVRSGRVYVVPCSVPILKKRACVVWVLLQNQTPHDLI